LPRAVEKDLALDGEKQALLPGVRVRPWAFKISPGSSARVRVCLAFTLGIVDGRREVRGGEDGGGTVTLVDLEFYERNASQPGRLLGEKHRKP
jgi:hypothetical protein